MKTLIDKLYKEHDLTRNELLTLLLNLDRENREYLFSQARQTADRVYGPRIYLRGLLEISNYCRNDCQYCGIRAGNKLCERYRLPEEKILRICNEGYNLGYRTFVLQGGEDPYYTDNRLTELISALKSRHQDCVVTLSLGERTAESYDRLWKAGAGRYLLRHETRSETLYSRLHPGMSYRERERCLWDLKKIGFQTGAGFMVGLPAQTLESYMDDLCFLKKLEPHMVGIGPFIPHQNTPLANYEAGDLELTRVMLALTRLLLPEVLLPATTALGSIDPLGWEKGIKAGANVVMLNLSPPEVRSKYALYNGKAAIPDESGAHLQLILQRIRSAGYLPEMGRGDHISLESGSESVL